MAIEHFDVLILGAGLSGIGAAHHLRENHPGKTVALLEAREDLGGTWDLFRYPGIRSDSDMLTLGFGFRPWNENRTLADGPAILEYLRETAIEDGTVEKIRFNQRGVSASWSSETATWTVDVLDTKTGETHQLTCGFLLGCCGYYRYDEGYTPEFKGAERFKGQVIHPQHWPEELDYAGKKVVVIGSGATAITLVPAMTDKAEHVTMLQRSPTYVASLPSEDPAVRLAKRFLPDAVAFPLLRWKNVTRQAAFYQLARSRPAMVKKLIRKMNVRMLPEGYDVDKHFTPSYNPWDQRVCLVPDGDLFRAIRHGKASVVTDHIDTFTEDGILLKSGETLEADIIVTATGLNLMLFGGIELTVDGESVDYPGTMAYKGMMLGGVPNYAFAIGYTNASWTLKADLTGEYVCRLLSHMDEGGFSECVPGVADSDVEPEPLLDFASGYVQRSIASLPKQGSKAPWRLRQNYAFDVVALRYGKVDDGTMLFSSPESAAQPAEQAAA